MKRFFATTAKYKELSTPSKAVSLFFSRNDGVLSTISPVHEKGQAPLIGCQVPFVRNSNRKAVIALYPQENHAKNIERVPHVSLVIYPWTPSDLHPAKIPIPKLNITGFPNKIVEENDRKHASSLFEEVHPNVLDKNVDFIFYEIKPKTISYHWEQHKQHLLTAEQMENADVDKLSVGVCNLAKKINLTHAEGLKSLCEVYSGKTSDRAFLYHVDTDGCNIMGMLRQEEGNGDEKRVEWFDYRFPFSEAVEDVDQCISVLEENIERALEESTNKMLRQMSGQQKL